VGSRKKSATYRSADMQMQNIRILGKYQDMQNLEALISYFP